MDSWKCWLQAAAVEGLELGCLSLVWLLPAVLSETHRHTLQRWWAQVGSKLLKQWSPMYFAASYGACYCLYTLID